MWLRDLKRSIGGLPPTQHAQDRRRNLVWQAIATAPAGFCHPRSSVLGTILDDIVAGKSAEQINAAYAAKTHGLAYQRPQAAPSEGAINQAEKLFAAMGLAPALRRRLARVDEVTHALWRPQAAQNGAEDAGGGVFGSLRKKPVAASPVTSDRPVHITRAKFERDILPNCTRIEAHVPRDKASFFGLVTAVEADAPPLLQWDRPEVRNPVSWYLYGYGSRAEAWRLIPGAWVNVLAYTELPCHWTGRTPNQDNRRLLVLEGASDTSSEALALFPVCMRGELHEVRGVIEAYSKTHKREDGPGPHACGIHLMDTEIRVHMAGVVAMYIVDREE